MKIMKRTWLVIKLDTRGLLPTVQTILVPDDTQKSMRFDRLASAGEWINKQAKVDKVALLPLEVRG